MKLVLASKPCMLCWDIKAHEDASKDELNFLHKKKKKNFEKKNIF